MLIRQKKNASFARDSIILGLGTAFSQGVLALFSPWLTRLYSPESFGRLAVYLSLLGIMSTVVTLRLEVRIVPASHKYEALNLLAGIILLSSLLSPVLSVMLYTAAQYFPSSENNLLANKFELLGIVLSIMCIAAWNSFVQWLLRLRKFVLISLVRLTQGTVLIVLALLFGLMKFDLGLILANLISVSISFVFVAFYLFFLRQKVFLKSMLKQLWKNRPTAYYILPAALLDIVSLQMPVLLISSFFSNSEAGQFSLAWRILVAPLFIIGGGIGQVFFQRVSRSNEMATDLRAKLFKTWYSLFILGFIPFSMLFWAGQDIFGFMFGREWMRAGEIASILSPALFAMFISSPTSSFYIVMNFQKESLFFSLFSFSLRTLALLIGYALNNLNMGLFLFCVFEVFQIIFYNLVGLFKLNGRGDFST